MSIDLVSFYSKRCTDMAFFKYLLLILRIAFYSRMGADSLLATMRYGERFLSIRRMIRPPFNPSRIASFSPVHRKETYMLLQNILKEPEKFDKHIDRCGA